LYGLNFHFVAILWHINSWKAAVRSCIIAKILTMSDKQKKTNQTDELEKTINKILEQKKSEKQALIKLLNFFEDKSKKNINKDHTN
jgi:hypothetical protein